MNKNTGGPAFPHLRRHVNANTYEVIAEGGMTLRDYFAAKAMQGILSDNTVTSDPFDDWGEFCAVVAKDAYDFADAMLKAREK